jgi:hypothetical protein
MFLRDVVTKLLYKKTWNVLAAPINDDELPGYSQRVTDPMDLSTLLWKVDSEKYTTIDAFLRDANLITKSAHEYWGDRPESIDGRQMLSKAHALEDTIAQMVSALDPQLVARCAEIDQARKERAGKTTPQALSTEAVTDSGSDRPARRRDEAAKGAPVWQNPDFVKDPEALARQLKRKAREEEEERKNSTATPLEDDERHTPEETVTAQPPTPASKPGPPAKEDGEVEEIKSFVLKAFVNVAKEHSFDFCGLESTASELARVAKDSMNVVSGLRVDALREAFAKLATRYANSFR